MANKIIKTFSTSTKAIDREAGIYEVMVSTESVDRDGDIIRAAGGKFDNYLKNPVVLWGHDYHDLPIAKTLSLTAVPGVGVKAKFQFPKRGLHPDADKIRDLWDSGFLNATSIGFIPLKSVNLNPSEPWGPKEFVEWELLEFSVVNVPANAEALRLAMKQARVTGQTRVEDLPPSVVRALGNLVGELESQVKKQRVENFLKHIRARAELRAAFDQMRWNRTMQKLCPPPGSYQTWENIAEKRRKIEERKQRDWHRENNQAKFI